MNEHFPIEITDEGITIFRNNEHPLNKNDSIFNKSGGIDISVIDLQSSKALNPISFTESGTMILSADEHPLNARFPIDITFVGIIISLNDEQFLKELCPINITDSGMLNSHNELQFSNVEFSIESMSYVIEIFVGELNTGKRVVF